MTTVELNGCAATPLGSYLKGIAVFRLVAEQADQQARAWWRNDALFLESSLDEDALIRFFLDSYSPTPILAPWNGGSGFYPKDSKAGIDAIAASDSPRFVEYRQAIATLRSLPEVERGKYEAAKDKPLEEERRTAIQRACRNELPERGVEWLDAAIGVASDDKRAFAPILGTGGNEGRLDYTNNFMERVSELLLQADKKAQAGELLRNALFASPTAGFRQKAAAGQFDPGRAGGANQGQGIEDDSMTNPWDFVLALEGTVAWSAGLYRRQGVSYSSVLCSPFTVRASNAGFGTASGENDSRAEIWTPLWEQRVAYPELKNLLREGRADVKGAPARNGLQFAEAAISLGVDRGLSKFVRYSLLKRRGDSYVALPAGVFPVATGYRSDADRVREIESILGDIDASENAKPLKRAVESTMFELLLHPGAGRTRAMMASLGRLLRRMATLDSIPLPWPRLDPKDWIEACGEDQIEVRVAAAVSSIWDPDVGAIRDQLVSGAKSFAWFGSSLPEKMIAVLKRRLLLASAAEADRNPLGGAYELHPGDPTVFIEHSTDDGLIEDLLFAFTCVNWRGFSRPANRNAEILPVFAILKHLFLARGLTNDEGENVRLQADGRILPLLESMRISDAAEIAEHRLRVAGLRPLKVEYAGGVDASRLGAALLIPVRNTKGFRNAVRAEQDDESVS
jgi:CRISPR-associated protein Csx17